MGMSAATSILISTLLSWEAGRKAGKSLPFPFKETEE